MVSSSSTRVIQVTNIAPQATKDQMQTLFGYLGKIDDIRLYPTIRDVSCPVQSRICYVKYYDSSTVGVAQHLTNTVFIDRALIVIPMQSGEIPDEHRALEMSSNGTLVPGLNTSEPRLPPNVINTLEGVPPNQVIQSHDARFAANGLPNYPPLPAAYDSRKIEEIRRTILVLDVPEELSSQSLLDYFCEAGEIQYLRFCERDSDKLKYALIEFSEQESVIKALKLNGTVLEGHTLKLHHATQAISKPQTKSNEAAQREIEEAMCRVKEAQNLISAAIDPVIGLLAKDKRRSRSRSHSRRRSRSKSRRRSRSRHRSRRSRSRHRSRRSRSKNKSRRSRSKSSHRSSRKSRSRSRHRSSRSKRDRSKDRDTKDKDRSKDKEERKIDVVKSENKEASKSPAKDIVKESTPQEEETDIEEVKITSPAETNDEEIEIKEKKVDKKRSLTPEKRRSRSREPVKRSRSKDRKKSRSKERHRSRSISRRKSRERKRSKSRKRSRSRTRKKSRCKSRDRKRSRSRDRKRSRSRDRKRTRSRDRKRSRSRDLKRSRSRDRKRSRSRDLKLSRDRKRERSRTRDRDRDRKRSRSKDRSKRSRSRDRSRRSYSKSTLKRESKTPSDSGRGKDSKDLTIVEEERSFSKESSLDKSKKDRGVTRSPSPELLGDENNSPDNMDISNSP